MQYPRRSVENLKALIGEEVPIIEYIDNGPSFNKLIKEKGYSTFFKDFYIGDLGACTETCTELIVDNIIEQKLKRLIDGH